MCRLRLKAKSQAKPGSLWARPSRAIGTGPSRALAWPEKLKSRSRRLRPGLLSHGFVDHRTSVQPHSLTTVAKNRLESPKVAICPCESMQELLALTCKHRCQPWLYSGCVTLQCRCGSPFPFLLSKASQHNAHSHSDQNTCQGYHHTFWFTAFTGSTCHKKRQNLERAELRAMRYSTRNFQSTF
jgi:hypothetical protein